MHSRCILLLLAVALGPAACLRPLDQLFSLVRPATDATGGTGAVDEKPWFCHDLDCPKYSVVNKTSNYELRSYDKGRWVGTAVSGLLYSPAVTTGFKRLFEYISGENENSTKIAMTSPVLTSVSPGQGPFCKSNFTVSFFLPFEFQDKAPQPSNKDVFLYTGGERPVFVSQFGGYLVDDLTLAHKAKALRDALVENNEEFDDEIYFTAAYDPPFRIQHRHNEIWYTKPSTRVA